ALTRSLPLISASQLSSHLCRATSIDSIDSNDARILALSGCPSISSRPRISIHRLLFGLIEKLTHFPQHLVEFRCLHLSNRVKNEVVFKCEKSLRTNEAWLAELSAFKVATIQ